MKNSSLAIRRMAISAIFLSVSLVLKTMFSFYIPMFGQNGMIVGISGIFSVMPSLLFGPVYGAIVAGLNDLLGYLLKPAGAYLPLMTLVVAAGGWLRGALWVFLRNRNMRIAVLVCSALLLAAGISNIVFLAADGINGAFYSTVQNGSVNTDSMHLISKMLIERTINTKNPAGNLATYITFVTSGVIGSAILGIVLLIADLLISKKLLHDTRMARIPQLLIAMVVSGLVVTTLNTVVLRETLYTAWKALPFMVLWVPRAIEEILSNTVMAYFVAVLMGVFEKRRELNGLLAQPKIHVAEKEQA